MIRTSRDRIRLLAVPLFDTFVGVLCYRIRHFLGPAEREER